MKRQNSNTAWQRLNVASLLERALFWLAVLGSRMPELNAFSTMLKHKNPVCGRCSNEQRSFLFGETAENVGSAAVIPLVAGADLGLLGLGGREDTRFQSSMGTEFLTQVGELVSAALAVHMEK